MVFFIAGSIMFHVRRRPADYMPRKRKKKPAGKWNELDHRCAECVLEEILYK